MATKLYIISVDSPTNVNMLSRTYFKLPKGDVRVWVDRNSKDAGAGYDVGCGDAMLARWTADGQTRVSPAMVNDDRAQFGAVLRLQLSDLQASDVQALLAASSDAPNQDLAAVWTSIYALWLHPDTREDDLLAVAVEGDRIGTYLRCTGLGVVSPFSFSSDGHNGHDGHDGQTIFHLYREAFWQGAGAPDEQHWLQSRPEVTSFPGFNGRLGVFASQTGFTRKGNVCTVHPVRPPKPAPGTVIYSRFIMELGQRLQIRHIDAANPVHFDTYKRWQNSDRVHASWRERGPDEHHRAYLAAQLADPHSLSCVFEWDGELAGYTELGWVKEDNAACFFGSNCNIVVGEHDQNSHILVGEEHFRGGKRYQAVATSIKHCCFLRDPRTRQVVAEPQFGLAHVEIQNRYLPQEKKKRFHLPHKTAVLFALQRDRFFQEAHFV